MLSVKVEDGHVMDLTVEGDIAEIACDVAAMVEALCCTLRRASPQGEAEFRTAAQWLMADDSPVWTAKGEILDGTATVTTLRPGGRKE